MSNFNYFRFRKLNTSRSIVTSIHFIVSHNLFPFIFFDLDLSEVQFLNRLLDYCRLQGITFYHNWISSLWNWTYNCVSFTIVGWRVRLKFKLHEFFLHSRWKGFWFGTHFETNNSNSPNYSQIQIHRTTVVCWVWSKVYCALG